LVICQDAADKRGEANALWWLAKVDLEDRAFDSASTRLGAALQTFRAFEMRDELLGCLEDHACLARGQGLIDLAIRLAAAAAKSRQRLNLVRTPRGERRWQMQLDLLRRATTPSTFGAAWNEGQTWLVDQAVRAAMPKTQSGRSA